MPLDGRIRMQFALSLDAMRADKKLKVNIDDKAADRVHAIASSASPNHPAVLVIRAQYLLNSGRWIGSDEIVNIVHRLERNVRSHSQSWMIIAYYYGMTGDTDKASKALIAGLEAGASLGDMQPIANSINMEITEQ